MEVLEGCADGTKEVVHDLHIVEVRDAELAQRSDVDESLAAEKPVFEVGKGDKV